MILWIGIGIVVVIALYMLWAFCRIGAISDRDCPPVIEVPIIEESDLSFIEQLIVTEVSDGTLTVRRTRFTPEQEAAILRVRAAFREVRQGIGNPVASGLQLTFPSGRTAYPVRLWRRLCRWFWSE